MPVVELARTATPPLTQDDALAELLVELYGHGYRFVTPTPATHARVLARPGCRGPRSTEDVLGWSLPFERGGIDPAVEGLLYDAGELTLDVTGVARSSIRVSSLRHQLFLHSSYPTDAADAVFLGPDSYRFADLIERELEHCPDRDNAHIVDIGAGAGVGAIVAALACPNARITMTDVNRNALRFARINAEAAGVEARYVESDTLDDVEGEIDIALANPPYIIDNAGRSYRDGGGMRGGEVALEMASMALARLAPAGRMILYTGSAIVKGNDPLKAALSRLCDERGARLRYQELDPDVFGEELARPEYRDVERIAVVAAIMTRPPKA